MTDRPRIDLVFTIQPNAASGEESDNYIHVSTSLLSTIANTDLIDQVLDGGTLTTPQEALDFINELLDYVDDGSQWSCTLPQDADWVWDPVSKVWRVPDSTEFAVRFDIARNAAAYPGASEGCNLGGKIAGHIGVTYDS